MQSIESFGNSISLDKEGLEGMMPGEFVTYNATKQKSSRTEVSIVEGVFRKTKKRNAEKTIYEFLSLAVWNELLKRYSQSNKLLFMSPQPIGVENLETESPGILMSFLNGYALKKIGSLKRTTPVQIKGQSTPIPIFPACALHLGALNRIKEVEGLYHSDYDTRHVIFSPVINPAIGVVDLENSRVDEATLIERESKKVYNLFLRHSSSPKDRDVFGTWYHEGEEGLIVPDKKSQLDKIVSFISEKYSINFDLKNRTVGNTSII